MISVLCAVKYMKLGWLGRVIDNRNGSDNIIFIPFLVIFPVGEQCY